jgi:hypothetical protein
MRRSASLGQATARGAMKAFISYSHLDRRLVENFRKHLKPLAGVDVWIDQMILAGDKWEDAILRQLNDAGLILFCISADFLWSHYIEQVEVTTARERMARGECAVVPVILRVSDLGPLSGLTGLRSLSLADTPVRDLGPLRSLPDLRIDGLFPPKLALKLAESSRGAFAVHKQSEDSASLVRVKDQER